MAYEGNRFAEIYFSSNKYCYYLTWQLLGQSIEGNYSTVRLRSYIYVGGSYISWTRGSASLHDTGVTLATRYNQGDNLVITRDINISHNGGGTGGANIGGSIDTTYIMAGSCSGSFGLPTIPRAAKITGASDFNDEQNPWVTFSNPGGFNMNVWLEPNPPGTHLCIRNNIPNTGSYNWILSETEKKQLRQACKGNSCTIRIGLYSNNNTFVDYVDRTFYIANGNPVFTTATWKTTNRLDLANNQTVIKGYSDIEVAISPAVAQKEASIVNYKVICGSKVIQQLDISKPLKLTNVDDSVIRIFAIDSRGNVTEIVKNITNYILYSPVTVDTLTYTRSLGGIGTGVTIDFSGRLWANNFGISNNVINAQYYYRVAGSVDWIQGVTEINPTYTTNYTKNVSIRGDLGASGFDAGKSYDFKVVVNDKLTTWEKVIVLASGIPNLALHSKGVGFGGFYNTALGGSFQASSKDGSTIYLNDSGLLQHKRADGSIKTYAPLDNAIVGYNSAGVETVFIRYIPDRDGVNIRGVVNVGGIESSGHVWAGGLKCMRTADGNIDNMQWGNTARTYIHVATPQGGFGINVFASDERYKKNIKEVLFQALDKILQFKHYGFEWDLEALKSEEEKKVKAKKKEEKEEVSIGYIADDLQKIMPDLVFEVGEEKRKQIDQTKLIPLITKGMQELQGEIEFLFDSLVDEIGFLKKEIDVLKKEMDVLKKKG